MVKGKSCVYVHRRSLDDSIFYIGHGSVSRANNMRKAGRSDDYLKIVSSQDCYCQIIESELSKAQAEQIEQELIYLLLDMGVQLVNKVINTSIPATITRNDYHFLDYSEDTEGNLVWNCDRYAGSKKRPYLKTKSGSKAATLNKTTGYYSFRNKGAHRIVWAIVKGECPSDKQVNHKDGNKGNNKIENLELVTASENSRHAVETKLRVIPKGEDSYSAILTNDIVLSIYKLLELGLSNEDIADKFNIEWKHVSLLRNGKRWKHLYDAYNKKFPKSMKSIATTDDQLLLCIKMLELGDTNKSISEATGIERSTVSRIRNKRLFVDRIEKLNKLKGIK